MAQIVTLTWVDPSPTTNARATEPIEIWRSISGGALEQLGSDLDLGVQTLVDNNSGVGFADGIVVDYEGRIYNDNGGEVENTDYIVTDLQVTIVDTADGTAPTMTSATIENASDDVLDYVFDEAVTITTSGWALTSDGGALGITSVLSGSGTTTPKFQLSRSVLSTETITIEYNSALGNTVDLASTPNELATFTNTAVTNSVASSYIADITMASTSGTLNVTSTGGTVGVSEDGGATWTETVDGVLTTFVGVSNVQCYVRAGTGTVTQLGFGASGIKDCTMSNITTLTNGGNMFNACTLLETLSIPVGMTSNMTNFNYFIKQCAKLITLINLDTTSGTLFQQMFATCTLLETITCLDTTSGTVMTDMFTGCTALTDPDGTEQTALTTAGGSTTCP